ncbi:MAG: DUF512 domain-containing protein [Defluviitaleaceae bacterium]|nr:DUF512 domain-containing protein [Defluviitaleaceae bacterium]
MIHEIIEVLPESIACELEITPGDILLQLNGKKIQDVLDYQFTVQSEDLLLEIQKPCGEIWELEIEKDSEEDLGLIFKHPLMSAKRRCRNKCVFCFIDQQPPGLRSSLYFKDDDARLSFLHGNYVTLTNISEKEVRRLAGYHLSPLRISVHAADLDLRKKMMSCENASNLFTALKIFANAGIKMHFQVVLCKGLNDGENLSHTISVLSAQKGAESLAIVPAGITRHREGLHTLSQFTPEEARAVLAQIKIESRKNFVFAADEWYIMAGEPLPPYEYYKDFPQLDNGVGMLRLFEHEFLSAQKNCRKIETPRSFHIGIITGQAAAEFMSELACKFKERHANVKITIHTIKNSFFGESITVSGLLTGEDIIAQLKNNFAEDVLFLPENAFRANTEDMLDGTTLTQLSAALGVPVKIGSLNGEEFYMQLLEL